MPQLPPPLPLQPPGALPADDRLPRAVRLLRSATAVSVLAVVAVLAFIAWSTHDQTVAEGRSRLLRLVQIAQEQALRIVETNDVIARSVLAATDGATPQQLRSRAPALHVFLRDLTQGLPQMQSLWIWDTQGRPVASSLRPDPPPTLNVSDRAYFIWARTADADSWYISETLRSRATGAPFFDFSRRRETADGQFAGALSVSLRPDYFEAFFREQVQRQPGHALTLLRADGALIARYPPAPDGTRVRADSEVLAAMQRGELAGEFRGLGSLDGQMRHLAYRRVGLLPLYVVATVRDEAMLEPWRASLGTLLRVTVPLTLALAAVCWFAIRRVQREHALALTHRQELEQRLRAEEALRQSQKMEALGRLTGGVAHDFNNILMVVQSSVAVARRMEQQGRPVGAALEPVERAVRNGAQLTRQLLAVARRQPLQVREVRLQDVIGSVSDLMSRTLGSAVQVGHEVAPASCVVAVDQSELELALINLCINARDAMADGGGQVRLRAQPDAPPSGTPADQAWVRISVSDTGQGIPPELLPRVTEPFFTTKPAGKGTGLGLSQVASFVQHSGGLLEIDSQPGVGTTVSLRLPCRQAALPDAAAPVAAAPRLSARVLLVEDDADIRASLQQLLSQAGADVVACGDAAAAQQALRAATTLPEVVLCDIQLGGGMSGVELARRLRADHPALPVVLMTGYSSTFEEAVALGLTVLAKPVAPDELVEALQRALGSRPATPA